MASARCPSSRVFTTPVVRVRAFAWARTGRLTASLAAVDPRVVPTASVDVAAHCRRTLAGALVSVALLACASRDHDVAHVETSATGPVDVAEDGRRAPVRLPSSYDPSKRYPLVIVLHGYGGTAPWTASYLGLDDAVERAPLVLALPTGSPDGRGRPSWNARPSCCRRDEADDAAYLVALTSRLEARYSIDPSRVYVVGHSNGGYMAHRLACVAASHFAAVVSAGGALFANLGACSPDAPVAVLEIHGSNDASTRYDGGYLDRESAPLPYLGAERGIAAWAKMNRCKEAPDTARPPLDIAEGERVFETRVTAYSPCAKGGAAELWTIEGAGHLPVLGPKVGAAILGFLERNARR